MRETENKIRKLLRSGTDKFDEVFELLEVTIDSKSKVYQEIITIEGLFRTIGNQRRRDEISIDDYNRGSQRISNNIKLLRSFD